jgi:hypothetical protein
MECIAQLEGKDAMAKHMKGNTALQKALLVKCDMLRKEIKHYQDLANLIGRLK